jgi:putative addiction module component (TIGR02574 family)
MSMTKEQIIAEAMSLDAGEREDIAEELLLSLDGVNRNELVIAWAAELDRRLEAMDRGEAKLIDGEEVMRELREQFGA